MLGHTKRVLLIAAHPDDEDTELLTYLVRREGAEAAYLSLTRGEGGQNLVGTELFEGLGLLRSGELLAARELDGARQYFTRAFDFGFSKTIDEAFRFWPRDSVLKDVVRTIRRFEPQIVVATFSGTPRDGHGQHQVAGWAARAAFEAAGDPRRFPELEREEGLAAWAPSKLYRSARFDSSGTTLILDGGELDREIGQSYRQIAMRGRSLHRSQDMGVLQEMGPSQIRLALETDRTGAGSELFAGIDTTAATSGIAARDLAEHAALAEAIRHGLILDATTTRSKLIPGSEVEVTLSAWNAGSDAVRTRLRLAAPDGWSVRADCLGRALELPAGEIERCTATVSVPASAPISNPYFLRAPRDGAMYRWVGPASVYGLPFDPPLLVASFTTDAGGAPFTVEREVRQRYRDQAVGEVRRSLVVVPAVDVKLTPSAKVWPTGQRAPQPFTVTLQLSGPPVSGEVELDLPPGWPSVPARPFALERADERRAYTFMVAPPGSLEAGRYAIRAFARDQDGRRYDTGVVTVDYPHIRERGYAIASTAEVHAAAIALPADRRIAYVRGASDRVPEALADVGLPVEVLTDEQLERADLGGYDAIVIGSRAYETNQALVENNGRILEYVKNGGQAIVQYQQQTFFRGDFAPYPLTLAPRHDRVTDETAPIEILAPDDPIFASPNRIGPGDFEGWVQERGLYFARSWDERYRPLISSHDPGEPPLRGGLLLARVGKGTYLYSGLAFFRQLPAGVPGALRLFVNLLDVRSRGAQP
ncbi:MAG: PIG-L family deacetylase [Gemmatimonadales bacterium]